MRERTPKEVMIAFGAVSLAMNGMSRGAQAEFRESLGRIVQGMRGSRREHVPEALEILEQFEKELG